MAATPSKASYAPAAVTGRQTRVHAMCRLSSRRWGRLKRDMPRVLTRWRYHRCERHLLQDSFSQLKRSLNSGNGVREQDSLSLVVLGE